MLATLTILAATSSDDAFTETWLSVAVLVLLIISAFVMDRSIERAIREDDDERGGR